MTFNIIIFDKSVSYMVPSSIDYYTYYLKDPVLTDTFTPFLSTRSYLPPIYELQNLDGTPIDTALFSFNSLTLKFGIYSLSTAAIGTYALQLKGTFDPTLSYSVTSSFIVTILRYCVKNYIQAPQEISDQFYYVTDMTKLINLPNWKQSRSDCGSLRY